MLELSLYISTPSASLIFSQSCLAPLIIGFMYVHVSSQNAKQDHNIKTSYQSFKNVCQVPAFQNSTNKSK
jgi:uncharacterized membrane protein YciS (DUF1049 family)